MEHILKLSWFHNSCQQNFCVTKCPKTVLFFQFHIPGTVYLAIDNQKVKKKIWMIKFFLLLQDGKVPPPPGFSVPRPSSSSNGNNFHQRSYESKMSPHGQPPHPGLIKSSPLSDESPSSDRLSQSKLLIMKSGFVFKMTMILTQYHYQFSL